MNMPNTVYKQRTSQHKGIRIRDNKQLHNISDDKALSSVV